MMAAIALAGVMMLPTATPTPPTLTAISWEIGFEASAYQGDYFNKSQEGYRECVAYREARHNYKADSYHVGTYQFTDALARGAVWMMAKEWAKKYGKATAKAMRVKLHTIAPHKWSREIWDQAFYTVLNWQGKASGEKHWAVQRGFCSGAK
jgi:hypothetical protein